jgi:hypothetical protein
MFLDGFAGEANPGRPPVAARRTSHKLAISGERPRSTTGRRATRGTWSVSSKRKLVEEGFGWMMTIGGLRRTRFKGLRRTQLAGTIVAAANNLLRICRLLPATT